jgi:predicted phosphodiesterase
LTDVATERIDRLVVAGDLVNWGPFSAQVVQQASRDGWAVIRGNNELYLLDHGTPRAPAAWGDREQYPLLPWLQEQFTPDLRALVAAWPDTLCLRFPDGPPLRIVHGTPRSPWEPLYPDASGDELRAILGDTQEEFVVAAHTHIAMNRLVDRWRLINPGSVGVPLDGSFEARYVILESDGTDWRTSFRRAAYDRQPLFDEFERVGFRDRCGVIGELVLDEFRSARLRLHPFAEWRRTCCPNRSIDQALLDEFRQTDWRPYAPTAYR